MKHILLVTLVGIMAVPLWAARPTTKNVSLGRPTTKSAKTPPHSSQAVTHVKTSEKGLNRPTTPASTSHPSTSTQSQQNTTAGNTNTSQNSHSAGSSSYTPSYKQAKDFKAGTKEDKQGTGQAGLGMSDPLAALKQAQAAAVTMPKSENAHNESEAEFLKKAKANIPEGFDKVLKQRAEEGKKKQKNKK